MIGNTDGDTAFCGTVQFGERQTGHLGGRREGLSLLDGILTRAGIKHEHHIVGSLRQPLTGGALDLRELAHEVDLVVQPPGGVDDGHVEVFLLSVLHRFVGHGGGVGVHPLAVEVAPHPFRPNLQLIHGGGPEGVGRTEHHAVAALLELVGQLPDGGGFTHPIHTNHQ